jgi:hypothetical protein
MGDGTWGRTQKQWNTFLIIYAMKRKGTYYQWKRYKVPHKPVPKQRKRFTPKYCMHKIISLK